MADDNNRPLASKTPMPPWAWDASKPASKNMVASCACHVRRIEACREGIKRALSERDQRGEITREGTRRAFGGVIELRGLFSQARKHVSQVIRAAGSPATLLGLDALHYPPHIGPLGNIDQAAKIALVTNNFSLAVRVVRALSELMPLERTINPNEFAAKFITNELTILKAIQQQLKEANARFIRLIRRGFGTDNTYRIVGSDGGPDDLEQIVDLLKDVCGDN